MWVSPQEFSRLQDKVISYSRKYQSSHRAQSVAATQKWRSRNLTEARKRDLALYYRMMADPVRRDKLRARWRIQSRLRQTPEYRASMRPYFAANKRERERTDPGYRIQQRLRSAIAAATSGRKLLRGVEKYLGCSLEFFRKYIEQRFRDGMTWGNYGVFGWHIDHVIPVSHFAMTKKSDQLLCFHYTNLQPLWRSENMAKGNKIERQQLLAI